MSYPFLFQNLIFEPSYLKLYRSGELDRRVEQLYEILKSCRLCPRNCCVDRTKQYSEQSLGAGFCRSGMDVVVSSSGAHFGEEPELVGNNGSGAIFLSNCNLACVYCQNYAVSHFGEGRVLSVEETAREMLKLQAAKCHNINFVSPTHFIPQLVKALRLACEEGLRVPIVYNCGGYENVEVLKLLEGIVDIYMPDIKYSDNKHGKKYSNVPGYFDECRKAVKEMHRQVGDLRVKNGIACRGLLVRHLVLPNDIAGSRKVLAFISRELSKETYVNIMAQYSPCHRSEEYLELNRRVRISEYQEVLEIAREHSLLNLRDSERFKFD